METLGGYLERWQIRRRHPLWVTSGGKGISHQCLRSRSVQCKRPSAPMANRTSEAEQNPETLELVGLYRCVMASWGRRLSSIRSADVPGGKKPRYFPSRPTRKTKPEWSITASDFFDCSFLA